MSDKEFAKWIKKCRKKKNSVEKMNNYDKII